MPTIFNELPQALTTALKESFNITEPMPVQTASFPLISEGRNLVLQSRTGSGKTLAYLLPLLAKLTPGESGNKRSSSRQRKSSPCRSATSCAI